MIGNKLFTNCINTNSSASIYDYSFYDIRDDKKQNLIALSKYKGKTLVIVNTATYCGYTNQYPYFNKLKDHYSSGDFEILAFPCNQFALVSEVFIFLKIYLIY
jgi:glutathione peroxidase-family protein